MKQISMWEDSGAPKQRNGWHVKSTDQILREFNSIIMQTFSLVFVEKHGRWSREWKPTIYSLGIEGA